MNKKRALVGLLITTAAIAGPAAAWASSPEPYYENCTAARAAGAEDIPRGGPGYRPALDRDNDGIACESGGGNGSTGDSTAPTTPTTTASAQGATTAPAPAVKARPGYTG